MHLLDLICSDHIKLISIAVKVWTGIISATLQLWVRKITFKEQSVQKKQSINVEKWKVNE